MARPQKPEYEYVDRLKLYRKRIKGPDGKYIAIYGKTSNELTEKLAIAQRQIEEETYHRENPTVEEYATKWLEMHGSHIRTTTLVDYTSKVKIYIIEPLGEKYMAEVTPGRCEDVHRQGCGAVSLNLPGCADALQDDLRLGGGEPYHR